MSLRLPVPALLLAAAFLALPASAATISFAPARQSVGLGDTVSVDIVIADLGGEIVSAYDLNIQYDAAVLNAIDVSFDSGLGDVGAFEVLDSFDLGTPGLVDIAQVSLLGDATLLALQGGHPVRIATLVFETVAPGTTSLDFFFDATNDVKGAGALVLDVSDASGSIRVTTPIPEPGAAILFGFGVVALHRRIADARARDPAAAERRRTGASGLSGRRGPPASGRGRAVPPSTAEAPRCRHAGWS